MADVHAVIAAAALAEGRRVAESLMVDTCTIRRATGIATDPTSGGVSRTYTTLYEGPCRFQQRSGQASEEHPGEAHLLMLRFEVQLPMAVTGLQAEDEVICDGSVHDPDLSGRVFTIRDLAHKTHAVSRRVQVMELTS